MEPAFPATFFHFTSAFATSTHTSSLTNPTNSSSTTTTTTTTITTTATSATTTTIIITTTTTITTASTTATTITTPPTSYTITSPAKTHFSFYFLSEYKLTRYINVLTGYI